MWLNDMISQANLDIHSEKAKKIRKKLIWIGSIVSVVGFGGALACFVLFATAGFRAFGPNGFTARTLAPFCCLVPACLIGGFGASILKAGLSIVVGGIAVNIADVNRNNKCPKCGSQISEKELFCEDCGENVKAKKICKKCGTENSMKAKFCKSCGKKLEE